MLWGDSKRPETWNKRVLHFPRPAGPQEKWEVYQYRWPFRFQSWPDYAFPACVCVKLQEISFYLSHEWPRSSLNLYCWIYTAHLPSYEQHLAYSVLRLVHACGQNGEWRTTNTLFPFLSMLQASSQYQREDKFHSNCIWPSSIHAKLVWSLSVKNKKLVKGQNKTRLANLH